MCYHTLIPVVIIIIAFLLIRLIITLPTDPSARELMEIQNRKRELRRKAGLYPFKW